METKSEKSDFMKLTVMSVSVFKLIASLAGREQKRVNTKLGIKTYYTKLKESQEQSSSVFLGSNTIMVRTTQ